MVKALNVWIWFLLPLCSFAQGMTRNVPYRAKDSIITPISTKYEIRSFLHRMVMGKNYRETWSTPVKLPIFRMSGSGFKLGKLGGGQQTKSLRLFDAKGKEWVLRTVDKTVSGAIPKSLNNTLVENVVQDMISASYPYSPLIVAELAMKTGVIAPVPHLYFVAQDKALGTYDSIFANTVCMLEEREPTPDGSETENTDKVKQQIRKENEHLVLQRRVLTARLLDMLVGDWDRHADQWRWDDIDSANTEYFYAIPRDRDNALFYARGFLPAIAKISFMPHITGFKKQSSGLRKLNRKSIDFDRMFLNELNADDWKESITLFQRQLTDGAIDSSILLLPEPVRSLDGEAIAKKLKSRRDGLMRAAMSYYAWLAGTVRVEGSDEKEVFRISGESGQLKLSIIGLETAGSPVLYHRLLNPDETHIIYLHGLKGDDQFIIDPSTPSNIRLRIYGNEGDDRYQVEGKTKTKIYDSRAEKNEVVKNTSAKIVFR